MDKLNGNEFALFFISLMKSLLPRVLINQNLAMVMDSIYFSILSHFLLASLKTKLFYN